MIKFKELTDKNIFKEHNRSFPCGKPSISYSADIPNTLSVTTVKRKKQPPTFPINLKSADYLDISALK